MFSKDNTSSTDSLPSSEFDSKATQHEHLEESGLTPRDRTDLSRNLEAKLRNPLEGVARPQLMRDVQVWCEKHNLSEHLPLFRKGALVAQNPPDAHLIDGEEKLSFEELDALEKEVTHKWRMPLKLFLTIATCSIGAAVQGWDQTGSNGAALFFPEFYGIGSTSDRDTVLVGLVMAGPYIGCA